MLNIRPFRALRPGQDYAERFHINHSDAVDLDNIRAIAKSNPYSVVHLSHADLALSSGKADPYTKFKSFIDQGVLISDESPCFYVYRISMANHSQTGLIACIDIEDYIQEKIKKHELTRDDKTLKQEKIIDLIQGGTEPIMLAYDSGAFDEKLIEDWAYSHDSVYDILDADGTRHELWVISDDKMIAELQRRSKYIESLYICDGHHRIEAAARYYLGTEHKGNCRYFLSVIFPSDEMLILDYNRAVQGLNGMSADEFLQAVMMAGFDIEKLGPEPAYPMAPGEYTMTINDIWYRLTYREEIPSDNPVAGLDVSILQQKILDGVLGIKNPQADSRLEFIRGTKGLIALQDATHSGASVAFAIRPPDMTDIMRVADANRIMPPKSTWFEPKPAGGLVIYHFSLSSSI